MSGNGRVAMLPVSFFKRPVEVVARELLGTLLVSRLGGRLTSGRVVETEAYLGYRDPASHGYRNRRNARNAALFGPPGSWYVYLSYGIHWCTNMVCGTEGEGGAVLFRALEPVSGLETMRLRRGPVPDHQLCSGPGKLCQALGISRKIDGSGMRGSSLLLVGEKHAAPAAFAVTPRIGISVAIDWPLRFLVAGSPWASRGPTRPIATPTGA